MGSMPRYSKFSLFKLMKRERNLKLFLSIKWKEFRPIKDAFGKMIKAP